MKAAPKKPPKPGQIILVIPRGSEMRYGGDMLADFFARRLPIKPKESMPVSAAKLCLHDPKIFGAVGQVFGLGLKLKRHGGDFYALAKEKMRQSNLKPARRDAKAFVRRIADRFPGSR